MKTSALSLLLGCAVGLANLPVAQAQVTVQSASNVVGTGDQAWSYLILEAEEYETELDENPTAGFGRVDATGSLLSFLENPILAPDTKASKKGALFTHTVFAQHADKVTYQVQFATPGTYYLYMRFTMFENGGNEAHYLNEDSFFLPPDWGKDPQTDWPLSDRGGYAEGCCDAAGYLYIPENGVRVNRGVGEEEGRAFWEGNFHWNQLISSQFLNAETQGDPNVPFKFVVTEAQVGQPLDFTISYREGGTTIDLFLFSTKANLFEEYDEPELDLMLLGQAPSAVTVQDASNTVGTGDQAWSYLIVEGEDYDSDADGNPDAGFGRVDTSGRVQSYLQQPILAKGTDASNQGALFTHTLFAQHADKVTYKVQFAKPGTYYAYMRFTMFENGGNETHYLNEDSFFLPPDWGKNPQTDWPLSDRGGYAEGCCDAAGYLYIPENGVRVNRGAGDEAGRAFWEGNFHWNQLISSQFLNAETQGEPNVPFRYVVTQEQVGKPLDFTISYREGGTTIDLFLFSTKANLFDEYTETQLNQILLGHLPEVTVQELDDVVGTGDQAWSYLILEGEAYSSQFDNDPSVGFGKVSSQNPINSFLGNPILGSNTTASRKGALFTHTVFAQHADKATYKVQFARPGTYYAYMRFTMFENGGNETHYLNEDSFFLPPDWGKDPQTDWPLSDRGGYAEGCCDAAGYLYIPENGVRVNRGAGDEAGRAFWEGNFHWNQLISSQFLNAETQGEPNVPFRYVVTQEQVGKPLEFTVSYREGGTTIDLFLFSTKANLFDDYTQEQLDQILLGATPLPTGPSLAIARSGNTATISWPVAEAGFTLESTGALAPATWSAVAGAPVVVGSQNTVSVDTSTGIRFYRLRK